MPLVLFKCLPPRSQVWRGCSSLLCLSVLLHPRTPLYLHCWTRELLLRSSLLGSLFLVSFPLVPCFRRILAYSRAHIFCHLGLFGLSSCRAPSPSLRRGSTLVETRTQGSRKRSRHCPLCEHSRRPPYRHLRIGSFRNCPLYWPWPPVHRKFITSTIGFRIPYPAFFSSHLLQQLYSP